MKKTIMSMIYGVVQVVFGWMIMRFATWCFAGAFHGIKFLELKIWVGEHILLLIAIYGGICFFIVRLHARELSNIALYFVVARLSNLIIAYFVSYRLDRLDKDIDWVGPNQDIITISAFSTFGLLMLRWLYYKYKDVRTGRINEI